MPNFYVYILTNKNNNVFYIGVTSNLLGRVYQHKQKLISGFTKKYNVTKLVYFEDYQYVYDALEREKQLKRWHRQWKIKLIKSLNSKLEDFAKDWF